MTLPYKTHMYHCHESDWATTSPLHLLPLAFTLKFQAIFPSLGIVYLIQDRMTIAGLGTITWPMEYSSWITQHSEFRQRHLLCHTHSWGSCVVLRVKWNNPHVVHGVCYCSFLVMYLGLTNLNLELFSSLLPWCLVCGSLVALFLPCLPLPSSFSLPSIFPSVFPFSLLPLPPLCHYTSKFFQSWGVSLVIFVFWWAVSWDVFWKCLWRVTSK